MTRGRKHYKKSLKVKSRTGPKAKSKARTGGRTRKLRSQRRSRKHKKYPKKKYLGGLHTVSQELGNCKEQQQLGKCWCTSNNKCECFQY